MTDQEQRREESLATDETRYERLGELEARRREEVAARLAAEPPLEPADDAA
jgi:hypothetical protein